MDRLNNIISEIGYVLDCLRNLKDIYKTGDCNNCNTKECYVKPKPGQMVRYNCPFYIKESEENKYMKEAHQEIK